MKIAEDADQAKDVSGTHFARRTSVSSSGTSKYQANKQAPRRDDGPRKRLPPLTPEERQRLMAEGACFRCRKPGHGYAQCPGNGPLHASWRPPPTTVRKPRRSSRLAQKAYLRAWQDNPLLAMTRQPPPSLRKEQTSRRAGAARPGRRNGDTDGDDGQEYSSITLTVRTAPTTRSQPPTNYLSAVTTASTPAYVPQLRFRATINGVPCNILLDSGCTTDVVAEEFALKNLRVTQVRQDTQVTYGDGSHVSRSSMTTATLKVQGLTTTRDFLVIPIGGVDAVLGRPFLKDYAARVDHINDQVHLTDPTNPRQPLRNPAPMEHSNTDKELAGRVTLQTTPATTRDDRDNDPALYLISATAVGKAARDPDQQLFLIHVRPDDILIDEPQELPTLKDQHPFVKAFQDVFPDKLPDGLPPERAVDHKIPTTEDHRPYARSPYRLSPRERVELRRQLQELTQAGHIRPSSGPYGAPVLLVRKADNSLRLCVDYRALNRETVRDAYPLPRIQDVLDQLASATVFSSLDLRSGYHQVRVAEEDVGKTAFNTPYGSFEWLVLPFGLTSAPGTFQRLMNEVLRDFIGDFVQVYLDDVIIYSRNIDEHKDHVHQVLRQLRRHRLYGKASKCQWAQDQIKFLGHVVSGRGVETDPDKIAAVTEWPQPKNVRDVRSFLGFCNFYRRFVKDYASVAAPLTDLMHKDRAWEFNDKERSAFDALKTAMTTAPVLAYPDASQKYVVQTDASETAVGGVLMQKGRPVAFESRRYRGAEQRYDVRDKEALAIVHCLRQWRHYLYGADFDINTDHRTLQYLQTQKDIKPRHARWMELLSEFGRLDIQYIPGKRNQVADALSRNLMDVNLATISTSSPTSALLEQIRQATRKMPGRERQRLQQPRFSEEEGIFYLTQQQRRRVYVPRDNRLRTKILKEAHDASTRGHRAASQTHLYVSQRFYWPNQLQDAIKYTASCDQCQRNKYDTRAKAGLLHPLPVPPHNWHTVSMDFITGLPSTDGGLDAILVVVDKLSERTHLLATTKTVTAQDTPRLFFKEIVRLHGGAGTHRLGQR
ncbi:hypothetical protein PTSG_13220, partial [Salpingoeca rosetta]